MLAFFVLVDAKAVCQQDHGIGLVGAENVVQAYVPAIHGKEKRKPQPGKEGLLGVEGVDDAIVLQCLRDALGAEAGASESVKRIRPFFFARAFSSCWRFLSL